MTGDVEQCSSTSPCDNFKADQRVYRMLSALILRWTSTPLSPSHTTQRNHDSKDQPWWCRIECFGTYSAHTEDLQDHTATAGATRWKFTYLSSHARVLCFPIFASEYSRHTDGFSRTPIRVRDISQRTFEQNQRSSGVHFLSSWPCYDSFRPWSRCVWRSVTSIMPHFLSVMSPGDRRSVTLHPPDISFPIPVVDTASQYDIGVKTPQRRSFVAPKPIHLDTQAQAIQTFLKAHAENIQNLQNMLQGHPEAKTNATRKLAMSSVLNVTDIIPSASSPLYQIFRFRRDGSSSVWQFLSGIFDPSHDGTYLTTLSASHDNLFV